MTNTRNPEVTRKKLIDALQRLVDGDPKRLTGKYKINVKSVQEEAGLSLGSAYRYPDVMDTIALAKQTQAKKTGNIRKRSVSTDLERLKEEKLKEKRLKDKYRQELDVVNQRLDKAYAKQTMQLTAMMNLLDVEDRIKLLQEHGPKVVRIK
jgi:3-oxoacyl-ACP reductase-like protein|tara:strand:+ start:13106 stop:13558 length:453 start_codon:yes stop_codon:yes gene_type:complete